MEGISYRISKGGRLIRYHIRADIDGEYLAVRTYRSGGWHYSLEDKYYIAMAISTGSLKTDRVSDMKKLREYCVDTECL